MRTLQLLLPVVVVSLLCSSRADDNSTATGVTFPLPSSCPTSCGNITFNYPFGVGHGCFRPGFELTCESTANPPKLLLGNSSSVIEVVDDINPLSELSKINVKAPVVTMAVHDNFSHTSWTAPAKVPYFISSSNKLVVVGCSAEASLVDLETNQIVANCSTGCLNGSVRHLAGNDSVHSDTCKGVDGCCTVQMNRSLQSYAIRLSRINDTVSSAASSSSVRAFIAWFDQSGVSDGKAAVGWRVGKQTCEEAQKETRSYACLAGSRCFQEIDDPSYPGYKCSCPDHTYQGNPYVPYGCDDPSTTVNPSKNCVRKCGNVSIPFPFGFEEGCYRDQTFALTCDQSSKPPALRFNGEIFRGRIDDIMVDEGKLEFVLSGVQLDGTGNDIAEEFYQPSASNSFGLLEGRAIYRWAIFEQRTCGEAEAGSSKFACRTSNSRCVDTNITRFDSTDPDEEYFSGSGSGYICKCLDGFQGNPYLGCTDIDECKNPQKYVCYGECINTFGSYICNCPPKTHGDPTKAPCVAHNKISRLLLGVIIGVSIGFGALLISMTSIFALWKWKKIIQKRIRERNFRENHGLLLQQLIASNEDTIDKVKIFSLEDLEKATNHFDSSRIIGQGGHGTVYKGILLDQHVVAIKKSKITEKSEIDEFLNEVTILSQINHRNVVKHFGCCLETEVPLLVYEFISNGTLFHHLHSPQHKSTLSWSDRLRIATEAAWALRYLHSSASISIFHRDMKSSNILLDDYFTAKVSDFGASRLIPLDQSHIVTAIQGTYGYIDPEYYQTSQLTEKSDVYSFGVILLELLTGEKPISLDRNEEEKNLIMKFLQALREDEHFELLETRVLVEGTREELDKVARLAEMCLKIKGSERPTMTEVEVQLQRLHKAKLQTRGKEITNGYEETSHLLRDFHSSSSNPIGQPQYTRTYSLEREMISSMRHPR